jgi:hypothetical protein
MIRRPLWLLTAILASSGCLSSWAGVLPGALSARQASVPLAAAQVEVEEESEEQQTGTDSDVFVPTEDISEDLAVPFPVDI